MALEPATAGARGVRDRAGTDQADDAGLPCFLETATLENVAYYSRRGFEVTGQARVAGFTLYGMVRPPA